MRHISIILSGAMTLTVLASSPASPQKTGTVRPPRPETAKPAKGKALVERLPSGAEGVVLHEGTIKLKPGYKFVKKTDNKVVVSRSSLIGGGGGGGLGVGGEWSCICRTIGGGVDCKAMIINNQLYCAPGGEKPCADKCDLGITTNAKTTGIIQY